MTELRNSPSGPEASEADAGATTSDIDNDSGTPGATMTSALNALATRIDAVETVLEFDDFLGGANANSALPQVGVFGELGWSFFGGAGSTLTRPTDNANYFGAYAVTVPASTIATFQLGGNVNPSSSEHVAIRNEAYTFVELVGVPDIGDSAGAFGAYRFGLAGSTTTTTGMGTESLRLEIDRAVNNNWRFVLRVAGIDTVIQSTIPYVPHTLAILRLQRDRNANTWTGSVNGTVIGTFTSPQLPLSYTGRYMCPAVQVEATAASGQALAVDRASTGFVVLN